MNEINFMGIRRILNAVLIEPQILGQPAAVFVVSHTDQFRSFTGVATSLKLYIRKLRRIMF